MELLEVLPPDLDLYAVADIQSLGTNAAIAKLLSDPPGLAHDEEYDRFIRATGFRYQEDLRQLALGKAGPDWMGAARVHVDRARAVQYMESQGAEKKDALGKTVYTFGRARPFRLVFLDGNSQESLVAFTIGGDRSRVEQAAARRSGELRDSASSELKRRNSLVHIPRGSKIWMVGKAERLWEDGADAQVGSLGLSASLLKGSQTLYASIEPRPAQLVFRVEDYCDSPASAQRIASSLRGLLALLRAMPAGKSKTGFDPRSLLGGISIEEAQQSVLARWQWDESALNFLESNSR